MGRGAVNNQHCADKSRSAADNLILLGLLWVTAHAAQTFAVLLKHVSWASGTCTELDKQMTVAKIKSEIHSKTQVRPFSLHGNKSSF